MITMLKQGKDYITDKHGIYTEYVCSSAADVVPSTDGGAASVYVLSNERTWVLLIEG